MFHDRIKLNQQIMSESSLKGQNIQQKCHYTPTAADNGLKTTSRI